MILRLLLVGLALAVAVWGTGCSGGPGATGLSADDQELSGAGSVVSQTAVEPAQLPEAGGEVQVRAGVGAPSDAAIAAVWAVVSGTGDARQLPMLSAGDGVFVCTASFPANVGASDRTYAISVKARDTLGRVSTSPSTAEVTVLSSLAHDGGPPAPPALSITTADASPGLLDFSGGTVTLQATLGTAAGVGSVQASIAGPDGTVDIDLPRNGESCCGTFEAPLNTTLVNRQYTVTIEVRDELGNLLASRPLTGFVVKGLSPPPPPPFP